MTYWSRKKKQKTRMTQTGKTIRFHFHTLGMTLSILLNRRKTNIGLSNMPHIPAHPLFQPYVTLSSKDITVEIKYAEIENPLHESISNNSLIIWNSLVSKAVITTYVSYFLLKNIEKHNILLCTQSSKSK